MTSNISKITVKNFQKTFKKMPIDYKSYKGIPFKTFSAPLNSLYDFYLSIGIDNNIEKDLRNFDGQEFGFKQIAFFINKVTNEKLAILGY